MINIGIGFLVGVVLFIVALSIPFFITKLECSKYAELTGQKVESGIYTCYTYKKGRWVRIH